MKKNRFSHLKNGNHGDDNWQYQALAGTNRWDCWASSTFMTLVLKPILWVVKLLVFQSWPTQMLRYRTEPLSETL